MHRLFKTPLAVAVSGIVCLIAAGVFVRGQTGVATAVARVS